MTVPEVEFVKEELPSVELIALAEKYQLPSCFFNYLKAQPCKGCIGCNDDEFDFDQIKPRPKETPAPPQVTEQAPPEPEKPTVSGGGLFAVSSGLDFASLASKTDGGFAFGKKSCERSHFSSRIFTL